MAAEAETLIHNMDGEKFIKKADLIRHFKELAPAMLRIHKQHKTMLATAAQKAARDETETDSAKAARLAAESQAAEAEASEPDSKPPKSTKLTEKEWLAQELPEFDQESAPQLSVEEDTDIVLCAVNLCNPWTLICELRPGTRRSLTLFWNRIAKKMNCLGRL